MPGEVIAITGHRPDKLGGWKPCPEHDLVKAGLVAKLTELQPDTLLIGMALGTDQWAAEIALSLGIKWVPFLPYKDFGSNWPPHAQFHLKWLLEQASQDPVICFEGEYERWKMDGRNRWMVDNCQRVLAVYVGVPGGTRNCLEYATKVGKPIEYVPLGGLQQMLRPRPVTNYQNPSQARSTIVDDILRQEQEARARNPQEDGLIVRPRVRRIIEE
jgi:uncharacterized phage-like protein YoqJ